jgi:hypothetical protein
MDGERGSLTNARFLAASKLAGLTAAESCTQSTEAMPNASHLKKLS